MQQAAGGGPAGLVVHGLGGASPFHGGEAEVAGDLPCQCPADEVSSLLPMAGVVAGQPLFEVGLAAGGDGQAVLGEPVQEDDGRPEVLTYDDELFVGDVFTAAAVAKTSHQVPGRVSVQDLAAFGGRVGGDEIAHHAFESDHVLVPRGQGAGGHEDAADVLDDLAVRKVVQGLVCQWSAAGSQFPHEQNTATALHNGACLR